MAPLAARRRVSAAAALTLTAALVAPAAARVFTGSVGGQQFPFLAKFAFGVDSNNGPVGTVSLAYANQDPSQTALTFVAFDDDDWGNIFSGSTSCAAAVANPRMQMTLAPGTSPVTGTFYESTRPHFWFMALANVPQCSPNVYLDSYTLTLLQADGNQLSYDEIGVPTAYGIFWAIYLIGLSLHVYFHYIRRPRFAPLLVMLLTWSLVLETLSLLSHLIDWGTVASNGIGVPFFAVAGALLRIGASLTLWVMAGLAANGFGISTYSLAAKDNIRGLILTAVALISYLALVIWYAVDRNPASTSNVGGAWPAIILLAVTLTYAGWFIFRIRSTILGETHTLKRRVLTRLAFVLGSQFAVLPLAEFIGAVTPPYLRLRVTTGMDIFFTTIVYAAIAWVLSPAFAGEAFRVYDGSTPAGFLSELADPLSGGGAAADFHAALDEAYSYTAMKEGAAAGGEGAVGEGGEGGNPVV